MESGDDVDSDEEMMDRTKEQTIHNSPGSGSSSRSSDNSLDDPSPSASNTSVAILHPTGPVNAGKWKTGNAFLNYLQDFRQDLRESNQNVKQADVMRSAGQHWRDLPDNEKQIYIDGALAIKKSKSTNLTEEKTGRKRARAQSKARGKKNGKSAKRVK